MIPALALLILGYDLAYYAINVLVWAHLRTTTLSPVPLRFCFGIPTGDAAPGDEQFMPPFQLGIGGAGVEITARQLLGGEPLPQISAYVPSAWDTSAGLVPRDQLPPELADQLDPDQSGVLPILPGEGQYGIPGVGVVPGIPPGIL